jgi:hypothetical protein
MDQIVPLISSTTSGPLGIAHLPRLWLKLILHATGRLPEGYRHGAGGVDEEVVTCLGIDRDEFIAYVETKLPTYTECEEWIKANAKTLDAAVIAKHNEFVRREKAEVPARQQREYIGTQDASIRNSMALNDLDDWKTVHTQLTKGALPPLPITGLNAEMTELLKELLVQTKASRTTIRIDLPNLGLEPSKPFAEAKRPEISSILQQVRTNMDKSGTINFMKREHRILVQDDLLNADSSATPPTELIQVYGTYAQMLAPVMRGEKLIAWISVHENTGARHWVDADVQTLQRATDRADAMLKTVEANTK